MSVSLQQRLLMRKSFKNPSSLGTLDLFFINNDALCQTNQAFIYRYMRDYILKIVKYEEYACGRDWCPFRAEFCQALMQEILSKYIVEAGLSPHVCLLSGSPVNPYYDEEKRRNVVFFMERAPMGSMCRFLNNKTGAIDEYVLLILFQVAYTLEAIYSIMPNFRHNDLKTTNVFVTPSKGTTNKGTYTEYIVDGVSFYVGNDLGITSMIGDFDFSCCAGVVDNYKVIEYWAMHPHNNINWKRNNATDLAYFIKILFRSYKHRMSPALRSALVDIYGEAYLKKFTKYPAPGIKDPSEINHMRGFPEDDASLPTVRQVLLKSSLFASFRNATVSSKSGVVTERYSTRKHAEVKIEWPLWALNVACRYSREVPFLDDNKTLGVSGDIFKRTTLFNAGILREGMGNIYTNYLNDNESSLVYAQLFSQHHLDVPIEEADRVVQQAQTILRDIITSNGNVPQELVEGLAVCAIIDAIYECNIYTVHTQNPDPNQWTQLLDNRYNTEQLLQIMLQYTWFKK